MAFPSILLTPFLAMPDNSGFCLPFCQAKLFP